MLEYCTSLEIMVLTKTATKCHNDKTTLLSMYVLQPLRQYVLCTIVLDSTYFTRFEHSNLESHAHAYVVLQKVFYGEGLKYYKYQLYVVHLHVLTDPMYVVQ